MRPAKQFIYVARLGQFTTPLSSRNSEGPTFGHVSDNVNIVIYRSISPEPTPPGYLTLEIEKAQTGEKWLVGASYDIYSLARLIEDLTFIYDDIKSRTPNGELRVVKTES